MCVSGVVSKTVAPTGSSQPAYVKLRVFFNDHAAGEAFDINALPKAEPQLVLIRMQSFDDAKAAGANVWSTILRGPSENPGRTSVDQAVASADGGSSGGSSALNSMRWVHLGLSRSATSAPEATAPKMIAIVVFNWFVLISAAIAIACFAGFIFWLARYTTLLRDNDLVAADPIAKERRAKLLMLASAQGDLDRAASDEDHVKGLDEEVAGAMSDLEVAKRKRAAAIVPQAVLDAEADVAQAEARLSKATRDRSAIAATSAEFVRARSQANASVEALISEMAALSGNNSPATPIGTYSLARTQVALWIVLVLGGYLYLSFTLGHFNGLITEGILLLLGINGLATIASVGVGGDGSQKKYVSRSFLSDILGDEAGPSVHRLQAVAWTLVLAGIFIWNVIGNFRFVDFDPQLLILLGISQSMYVGLKYQNQTKKE